MIAGHAMKPYTIGHALLLARLNSPFATGDTAPGLGDLKLALALCKRRFPRALALVGSRRSKWIVRWTRCPAWKFPDAAAQFVAYIAANLDHPRRWEAEGSPIGTPLLQQLKLALMMNLGKTELQALCTPLATAMWDAMGTWEMCGELKLADEDLLSELDEFKRSLDSNIPPSTRN